MNPSRPRKRAGLFFRLYDPPRPSEVGPCRYPVRQAERLGGLSTAEIGAVHTKATPTTLPNRFARGRRAVRRLAIAPIGGVRGL